MDVTCTRCGTDYEFEETLISTRGTTVKCTSCGHLFKVFRPEEAREDGTELPRTTWTVRHADGQTEKLASLAELTRRISEGQLAEDDQISRSGQAWKRLGEIDELRGFFAQGRSGRPPAPRVRGATPALGLNPPKSGSTPSLPMGVGSSRPSSRSANSDAPPSSIRPPPPPPVPRFESMGASVNLNEASTAASLPPASAGPSVPPPPPRAAPTPSVPPPAPVSATTTAPAPADTAHTDEAAQVDAAIAQALRPRRTRASIWLALVLLVAGAGASIWLALNRPVPTTPAKDPVTLFVDEGDAALASHRRSEFNDGVVAYGKALAAFPIDPHVLSSISRTYAVWAQQVQFELDDLAAREGDPALEHSARLRAELARLTGLAKEFAERAARKNPGNEEAEVALADALRLAGNLVAARSELDRARATEGAPPAETLRVAALLAIAEAGSNADAARTLAEQAVQRDDELIRARELLARVLASLGDTASAAVHVNKIRSLDDKHPVLAPLDALLARMETRKKAEQAQRLAEKAEAEAKAQAQEEAADDEAAGYRELVTRGEAQLERGAVAQAKHTFGRALALDPKGAEARTGLGYVALENGNLELSLRMLRSPAAAGHPDALIGLGDAYRRMGRLRDALKQYRTYQRRYPSGQRASIARRQIELLQEQINE